MRNTLTALTLLVTVALGALLWSRTRDTTPAVPEAFTVDNIRARTDQPAEMKRLFDSEEYKTLTPEQRQVVHKNKAEAYGSKTRAKVDEYSNAPPDQRNAILDRHIDELLEQIRQKKAAAESEDARAAGKDKGKGGGKNWTREQMKAKSESTSPDDMARIMAYKAAMDQRMRARGLQWP
jgi:hypothetical protein